MQNIEILLRLAALEHHFGTTIFIKSWPIVASLMRPACYYTHGSIKTSIFHTKLATRASVSALLTCNATTLQKNSSGVLEKRYPNVEANDD